MNKMKDKSMFSTTEDGKTRFHIGGLASSLKKQGLSFEERVKVLDSVATILEPALERQIIEWKREYESNPLIRREYSDNYSLLDFIPLVGLSVHERKNKKKDERHPYFYRRANNERLAILKKEGFNLYQFLASCATLTLGVMGVDHLLK